MNDKIYKSKKNNKKQNSNYNSLEIENFNINNVFTKLENEIKSISMKKNLNISSKPCNPNKSILINAADNTISINPLSDSLNLKNLEENNPRRKHRNSSVSYKCENKLLQEFKDVSSKDNTREENNKNQKLINRKFSQILNNEKIQIKIVK